MKTRAAFFALLVGLDTHAKELSRVHRHNLAAWSRIQLGEINIVDWGALGFTLHRLYGILENYFLRVSEFFDPPLPSADWHRDLVERMSVDIATVRPALITTVEMGAHALELLAFRQYIRNLCGEKMDKVRTADVQRWAWDFYLKFETVHAEFTDRLRTIAEQLP